MLATVAAAALWVVLRDGTGAMVVYEGTGLALACAVVAGVLYRRPSRRWPWLVIAAGLAMNVGGDLIYDLAQAAGEQGATSTLSNVLYLASYPATIAGVIGLMNRDQRRRDATVLIDGAVYALAGWLAIWVLFVHPAMQTSALAVLDWLPTLSYPPLDILVLVVLFRLGQGPSRWLVPWRLLCAAFVLTLVLDTLWAVLLMPDSGFAEAALSVGYLLSYGLIAAAAVHPDMAELGRGATNATLHGSQRARVAGLGLAAAVPMLLLAFWPSEVFAEPLVTAVVGLILVAGALVRVLLVLRRQREAERFFVWQATHDPLTGLANRLALLDLLDATRLRCRREGRECTVLFCDVDQFKVVNDSHGHSVGDELLVAIAQRLREAIDDRDAIGRLGGDEFIVISSSPSTPSRATTGDVIREAMRTPFAVAGSEFHVTMSIGVVRNVEGSNSRPETLISDADIAMYRAKDNGRDRIERFTPAMHRRVQERYSIDTALRTALAEGQFFFVFQPVMSLRDGSTIAQEALLRWDRPDVGIVMPDEFIWIAESTGLIADIGAWAIRHGARRSRALPHPVAVNVSARQLRDPEMAQTAQEIVASEGVAPSSVILEITETQLLEANDTVRANLESLRDQGFAFAIDDFGLGHSNIGSLKQLDVGTLKIDRSFVAGIGAGSGDETLIAGIITMAHALGMQVVAEGVEEAHQLELLVNLGCDAAQGYFLGRGIRPGDELLAHQATGVVRVDRRLP